LSTPPDSFKHHCSGVGVDRLPFRTRLKNRNQSGLWSGHRKLDAIPVQGCLPTRARFRHIRVGLEKIAAIEVASSVDEDLHVAGEAINQISAPLILRENSGVFC